MKLKLSQLKPNPFKKEINGGKLSEENIQKIRANIKELGLMGALPVFKKGKDYFLIAGHHRVEALKRTYGRNFKIECTIHNYTEDNILRGMVVENLTQRTDELVEITENLVAVKKYLIKNKLIVDDKGNVTNRTAPDRLAKKPQQGGGRDFELGSTEQIHRWLNKSAGCEVMSLTKIKEYVKIAENLDTKLLQGAKSCLDNGNKEGETISIEEAKSLARLPRAEQKAVKKQLDKTGLDYKEKGKLISEYLSASDEIQEKVKAGNIDMQNIQIEKVNESIKKDGIEINPDTTKILEEYKMDFCDSIDKVASQIEYINSNELLDKFSIDQLTMMMMHIVSWVKGDLAPLTKKILRKLKEEGKNSPNVTFEYQD